MGKRAEVAPKIDMWCVDGASSCNATYTEEGCYDIRPCHVRIESCNSSSEAFVCTRMGKRKIRALNEQTGEVVTMIADEVLIHEAFPFHILSEDKVFQKGCTAFKEHGSWQFRKPAGAPLFHASQRLANGGSGAGNSRLYFVDEQRPSQQASASVCMAVTGKSDECVPEKAPMHDFASRSQAQQNHATGGLRFVHATAGRRRFTRC
jgi:hypothetical protein